MQNLARRAETTDGPDADTAALSALDPHTAALFLARVLRFWVEQFPHFSPDLNSCINSVLIKGARTPERDRARVLKAMQQFGGGPIADIADEAKLPKEDVQAILDALILCGVVERFPRGKYEILFFLKDSPEARERRSP